MLINNKLVTFFDACRSTCVKVFTIRLAVWSFNNKKNQLNVVTSILRFLGNQRRRWCLITSIATMFAMPALFYIPPYLRQTWLLSGPKEAWETKDLEWETNDIRMKKGVVDSHLYLFGYIQICRTLYIFVILE